MLKNVLQIFSSAQHNSQLHERSRSGPEAVLDVVKDSKYPRATCSTLSLSWKREDNVLSHPPTLTTLYLCLFVKCLSQRTIQADQLCMCVWWWRGVITTMNITSKDKKYTFLKYHHSHLSSSALRCYSLKNKSLLDTRFVFYLLSVMSMQHNVHIHR